MGTYRGMSLKKIIYLTGTRADYGLMREVLIALEQSPLIDLSICVTGMHLSPLYGKTVDEIEADGFRICGKIPAPVDESSRMEMAHAIGHELIGLTTLLSEEKPDLLILLGDRGEMLAGALAAVHLNIPIVHLHGGERSGTVDEMVRHAISKLSHFHFVATEASRERLIKMGEHADKVFVVGAPGLDEVLNHQACSQDAFWERYALSPERPVALMIFHPVVQDYERIAEQFEAALKAALAQNLQLLCLEPNSDAGGQLIRSVLNQYSNHSDIRVIKHLRRNHYLDCLAHVDLMLGNSSSGIIEAASFNLPVINIGNRQNLRERSDNIIDVDTEYHAIQEGIRLADQYQNKQFTNVYGNGGVAERCLNLLIDLSLEPQLLNKYNAY